MYVKVEVPCIFSLRNSFVGLKKIMNIWVTLSKKNIFDGMQYYQTSYIQQVCDVVPNMTHDIKDVGLRSLANYYRFDSQLRAAAPTIWSGAWRRKTVD